MSLLECVVFHFSVLWIDSFAAVVHVKAIIINAAKGYGNSGMGFASPVTVPEMLPDGGGGISVSWKFMVVV